MTKKYKKLARLYFFLCAACLLAPITFYFIRAFVCGDATQKLTLGMTFTAALVIFGINIIMKSHLRSVIWVLLLGVFTVFKSYLAIVLVFAITTFAEELVFSPLYRYYKSKARINQEIDKRMEK